MKTDDRQYENRQSKLAEENLRIEETLRTHKTLRDSEETLNEETLSESLWGTSESREDSEETLRRESKETLERV